MKAIMKYLFVITSVIALLLSNVQIALADGVTIDIGTVSGGGTGYTFGGGVLTITDAGDYTITGSTSTNTIAVAGGISGQVNLTLGGVQMQYSAVSSLVIGAGDSVNLILSGSSILKTTSSQNYAGVTVPDTAALTISGSGSLTTRGSGTGAGIGMPSAAAAAGSIVVNGGTVNATGGYYDTGTGGSGMRGVITVNAGTITATGGSGASGGGSGLAGTVTVNGGVVTANGGDSDQHNGGAGIGGSDDENGGTVVITGGNVTASASMNCLQGGAGIGGGRLGSGGSVTITGGTVVAAGGVGGAGIGGGMGGTGGTVNISGAANVMASGTGGGAGIGGGSNWSSFGGAGGTTTISGGTVNASGIGGSGGSGIGAGNLGSTGGQITISGGIVNATGGNNSAGIGGAERGNCGSVLISGGQVTAYGGNQGAGIGSGYNTPSGGSVAISGGTVTATGGNCAAGIGGGYKTNGGTITIGDNANPTVVHAYGIDGGAGIGGGACGASVGSFGNGGVITINGGTVTAAADDQGGAGIGGGSAGYAGTITINGGLITASSLSPYFNTSGIGPGRYSYTAGTSGTVTINGGRVYASVSTGVDIGGIKYDTEPTLNYFNGGSVRAYSVNVPPTSSSVSLYRTAVTVTNVDETVLADTQVTYRVNGAGSRVTTATDESGKLYLWLPQTPEASQSTIDIVGGGKEYLASGRVTTDNAAVMTAAELTYAFSTITDLTCSDLTEGYSSGSQETQTIRITNTGTGTLTNLTAALDPGEDAYFDLKASLAAPLAPGASVDFTVTAKDGLAQGEYSATVTVLADKMDGAVFHVFQSVKLINVQFMKDGIPYDIRWVHYQAAIEQANWPADPTKDGYDFTGWIIDDENKLLPDTAITGNMTVTADWKATDYEIGYDLGNGVADPANPAKYTVESGDITLNNPVMTGYTFAGWTGTDLDTPAMSVKIPTGSIGNRSYTANWAANTYTVVYEANGGTGSMSSVQFTYGTLKALTANGYSMTGYTFTGWSTDKNGPAIYTDAQSVKNLTDENGGVVTLFAKWARADYTIGYGLNGGTVSTANPEGYNVESDDITLHNPTKIGYVFAGWSGTDISDNTMTVTITKGSTGNRTYTANWTLSTYTLTYVLNGGTVSPANPDDYTVESSAITLRNPTKAGYAFAGWSGTGISGLSLTVTIQKGSTGNRTYTANWKINYSIQASVNNASYGKVSGAGSYKSGDTVKLTATPSAGFRFVKWTEGSTVVSTGAVYSFTAAKARTLTAYFEKISKPTILSCASASYCGIKLTWSAVTGASGYYVYRCASATGSYQKVGTVGALLTYTDSTCVTGTTYFYKVQAYCTAGSVMTVGALSGYKRAAAQLAKVNGLTLTKASANSVSVKWDSVSGKSGYEVWRSTSASSGFKLDKTATSTVITDTGLAKGKTYYYKVRAYRVVNGKKVYGTYSDVKKIKT